MPYLKTFIEINHQYINIYTIFHLYKFKIFNYQKSFLKQYDILCQIKAHNSVYTRVTQDNKEFLCVSLGQRDSNLFEVMLKNVTIMYTLYMCVCLCVCVLSHIQLFVTHRFQHMRILCPWDSLGQKTTLEQVARPSSRGSS